MPFKNFIFVIFISSALMILSGCGGGGGGGSASSGGGFGFIPTNSSNTPTASDSSTSTTSQTQTNDSPTNPESKMRKTYNYSISGKGETRSIIIDCYKNWKIDTSKLPLNITVNPTSGNGTGETLTITIPKNTKNEEQKITIPIVDKNGKVISTISITQEIDKIKAWLFINYFACDNSLEDFHFDSLNAMEKVGSDENTHLIAYYDIGDRWYLRGGKYDSIIPEEEWPGGAREFYLIKDDTNKITSPIIKYYDDIYTNSANPEILADFLLRTIENYPAEKICISITDHGGAYLGAIQDETIDDQYNTCSTSLTGLYYAINEVYKKTGKKIDLLLFDDCLMANFEVAYEFRDIVSYMVGSEEISLVSIVDGMNGSVNYYGFLAETATRASRNNVLNSAIKSSIDLTDLNSTTANLSNQIKKIQKGLKSKITSDYDGKKLAEAILKSNKERRDKFIAKEYEFTNYNTCSIINCDKCNSLKNTISDFANYVLNNADETDKLAVKKATGDLIATYAKTSDIKDTYENIADYYGLVEPSEEPKIVYRPFGEIYGPYFQSIKQNRVEYLLSVSENSITDLGYMMQRIFSPSDIYGDDIPNEISSASNELKTKAKAVYDALKEVVPENYYYGTEKVSLIMYDDNYCHPFGYHKYSNGLSIGWFVYNKDSVLRNWNKFNNFNTLINNNKSDYTMNGGPTFYKDCPEWIRMQESLY